MRHRSSDDRGRGSTSRPAGGCSSPGFPGRAWWLHRAAVQAGRALAPPRRRAATRRRQAVTTWPRWSVPDGWTTWVTADRAGRPKAVARWTAAGRSSGSSPACTRRPRPRRSGPSRVEAAVLSRRRRRQPPDGAGAMGASSRRAAPDPCDRRADPQQPARGGGGAAPRARSAGRDPAVDGVPLTCVERALVDSWGRSSRPDTPAVRAAAITAVRRRMCRPGDLATELERRPQLRGRASFTGLVRLLAVGCQSELEIWGCLNALRAPGMPRFTLQHKVVVTGRTFFLDAACEEVQLAVEMDGAAWHGSRDQRERDIHRVALVATVGWQTLRFSFARMTRSPDGCRHDIRSRARRRLQLIPTGRSALRPRSGAPNGALRALYPVVSAPRRRLRGPRWASPASRSRRASATRPSRAGRARRSPTRSPAAGPPRARPAPV